MKTVAVYFSDPEPMGYPFDHIEFYRAYQALSTDTDKEGIELVFCRGNTYTGPMTFSQGWKFDQDQNLIKIEEPIQASLIYMKGLEPVFPFDTTGTKILNDPEFDRLCRDKLATYELFPEFMKKSLPILPESAESVAAQMNTQTIVLKPVFGDSGIGIKFVDKSKCTSAEIPTTEPYIAQEYLESIEGVPGIMTGRHDLRLVVANGEPVISYIRVAKEGSLLSNTHQGATVQPIDLEQLPDSCIPIVKEVDSRLAHFDSRMYSIDFMFESGKPFVTELNSRAGIPDASWVGAERARRYREVLVNLFKAYV